MRQFGKVDIPQEAFITALKVDVLATFCLNKLRRSFKLSKYWKN
jgi:hypothetical protein